MYDMHGYVWFMNDTQADIFLHLTKRSNCSYINDKSSTFATIVDDPYLCFVSRNPGRKVDDKWYEWLYYSPPQNRFTKLIYLYLD